MKMWLSVATLLMAVPSQASELGPWTTFTPPGSGITVDAPGQLTTNARTPGRYAVATDYGAFSVTVATLLPATVKSIAGNPTAAQAYMEAERDLVIQKLGGTLGKSGFDTLGGRLAILYSVRGESEGHALITFVHEVLSADHSYSLMLTTLPGRISNTDVRRFLEGLRFVEASPRPSR